MVEYGVLVEWYWKYKLKYGTNSATIFSTDPTHTDPWWNPDLCGEKFEGQWLSKLYCTIVHFWFDLVDR